MNHTRPKNLNLFTIRFPITAIVSILHRISGVFLFLVIPLALWGLHFSLTEEGFDTISSWAAIPVIKFIIWGMLAAFVFHLLAGIRHLFMDLHIGTSRKGGRFGATLTIILAIILAILAGIWLW